MLRKILLWYSSAFRSAKHCVCELRLVGSLCFARTRLTTLSTDIDAVLHRCQALCKPGILTPRTVRLILARNQLKNLVQHCRMSFWSPSPESTCSCPPFSEPSRRFHVCSAVFWLRTPFSGLLGVHDKRVFVSFLGWSISPLSAIERQLGFAVCARPPDITGLSQTDCHDLCRGHGVLSFITSAPEHGALVTGANVEIILADMHTDSSVHVSMLFEATRQLTILATQPLALDVPLGVFAELANHHRLVLHANLSVDRLTRGNNPTLPWKLGHRRCLRRP